MDQSSATSAAFILLLNEVTTDLFDVAVTGSGEAQIALLWDGDRGALREAREALVSGSAPADIWRLLYALDTTGRQEFSDVVGCVAICAGYAVSVDVEGGGRSGVAESLGVVGRAFRWP